MSYERSASIVPGAAPAPAMHVENKRRTTHGVYQLQRTMQQARRLGLKLFPRNTADGRAYWARMEEYVEALGGNAVVSPAQLALIDEILRLQMRIDAADAYVLVDIGPRLINRRYRRPTALSQHREQLAESKLRLLQALGLERRPKPTPSLAEYLRAKESSPSTRTLNGAAPAALSSASAVEAQR